MSIFSLSPYMERGGLPAPLRFYFKPAHSSEVATAAIAGNANFINLFR